MSKYHELYRITAEKVSKEVKETRKALGLKEIKQGKRLCLKCDKEFLSENLASNKMCNNCKGYKE